MKSWYQKEKTRLFEDTGVKLGIKTKNGLSAVFCFSMK